MGSRGGSEPPLIGGRLSRMKNREGTGRCEGGESAPLFPSTTGSGPVGGMGAHVSAGPGGWTAMRLPSSSNGGGARPSRTP